MRKNGRTYREVRSVLGEQIPKSTLSYWLQDIPLTKSQQNRIDKMTSTNIRRAQAQARLVNQARRQEYLKSLVLRNDHLFPVMKEEGVAKIALAVLYLGEGAKWKSHRGPQLGSSDPDIVKIYIRLLSICYGVQKEELRARVCYRADQNIENLTRFWMRATGFSKKQFYKTKPDPRTHGKATLKKDYRGVCVISGGRTEMQLELDIIARMLVNL